MRRVSLFLLIVGILAAPALADVVALKNGDRVTGTFVKIAGGKMVFNGALTGEVSLDLANIQTFNTAQPITVHLKDGTVLKSRAVQGQPGQIALAPTDVMGAQTLNFADIAAVNPPPKPKVKWSGSINAGFASTHGNTFSESGSLSFDAARRSKIDRTTVFARYLVSRTKETDSVTGKTEKVTTEESFAFGGKYDYFFSKKMYGFLNGRFKKDHIADLDRRVIGGAGIGYQWIEEDTMNFSTDLGLSEICEKYVTHGDVTKTDNLTVQAGYHFDWKITDKIDFIHNLTYFPSITDTLSDYFLTTDAEFRLALTESMFSSFKAILDYDSTPAKNVGSTDTKYILSIGWNF